MLLKGKTKTNFDLVLDAIKYHEIKTVRVYFSGNNDDGAIHNVEADLIDDDETDSESANRLLNSVKITTLDLHPESAPFDYTTDKRRDWVKKPPSLREAIEIVCYDILDAEAPGYEINCGAHGSITLTPLGPLMPTPVEKFNFEICENDGYDEDDDEEEYYSDEGPGD